MKKLIVSFLVNFFSVLLFSQEVLSNLNTSWSNVLPGKVISEPALTSYGFCLVTDAKTISSFTSDGVLLWEKFLPNSRNAFISVLPGDFILVFTENRTKMTLMNPSGSEIWNKKLNYEIKADAFPGRDGRFFIYGDSYIECYGMNGICKWRINSLFEINSIGIQELPDGSLVVFDKKADKSNGKTKGLRISPFGEVLEEITFAGHVVSSCYCDKGIFLTFGDGSAGFFSLSDDNKSENKWVLQKYQDKNKSTEQIENARFVVSSDNSALYIFPEKKSLEINKVNVSNGKIISSFKADNFYGYEMEKISFRKNLFLSDKQNAILLSDSGKEIWSARMPDKNLIKWNYIIYTLNNTLVFCDNNWSLSAYSVHHDSTKQNYNVTKNYRQYINISDKANTYAYLNDFDSELVNPERTSRLKSGFYSSDEIYWSTDLQLALEAFLNHLSSSDFGTRIENSVFDENAQDVNQILTQISYFGTNDFSKYEAQLIKKIKNSSYLITLLDGISRNGYDTDGEILDALEYLTNHINPKNEKVIVKICDAVYSICKFMGRPAFNHKGKAILSNFLYPTYSNKARLYTRETLSKIKNLDL